MIKQNTFPTPKHPYTPQFQLPEEFPPEEPIRRFKQLPDTEKERILRNFRHTKGMGETLLGRDVRGGTKVSCGYVRGVSLP